MKPSPPARTVHPVHFEDFPGHEFERLVFAYHARTDRWLTLEWIGQQGKDGGRDIVGRRMSDHHPKGELVAVVCANWKTLTTTKVRNDIDALLKTLGAKPDVVRVVCGHDIGPKVRDDIKDYVNKLSITCEVWSGREFEERIRADAESLLARFCEGKAFPDAPNDLLLEAWGMVPTNDAERLALIAKAFDRPAFTTEMRQESNLPAFRRAIEDTIRVLKTGIWQTREGQQVRRLPGRWRQ